LTPRQTGRLTFHRNITLTLGFWTLPIVWCSKEIQTMTTFRKLCVFPSSGERWELTSVERLRLIISNGPNKAGAAKHFAWRWKQIQFPKLRVLLCECVVFFFLIPDDGRSPTTPVILSFKHLR
jgi:hypothetical protein